jgi:hypothetical protein
MTEIMEYMRETLDWAAGRILEFLTGLSGYKLVEVKVRVPDVRRVDDDRLARRLQPSGSPCDRY